jgi:ferrous-iron efflux pump FieF
MAASPSVDRAVAAVKLAVVAALVGAIVKFAVGAVTGSMAMISSAVDSAGDLVISLVNIVVIRVANAPPDAEHNYGHAKLEGLGAMLEGGFIFAAGGFIIFEAVSKLVVRSEAHGGLLGIAVMLPLAAVTFAVAMYLRKVARETKSLVVKADALHYLTDVWLNVGVLITLVLVRATGVEQLDPIVSLGIAGYMLWSAIGVVREGFHFVMDHSLDKDVVAAIEAIIAAAPGVESFHELRTRAGRVPHIDVHIVVDPAMSAQAVHDLYAAIRDRVKAHLGEATLHVHADPVRD